MMRTRSGREVGEGSGEPPMTEQDGAPSAPSEMATLIGLMEQMRLDLQRQVESVRQEFVSALAARDAPAPARPPAPVAAQVPNAPVAPAQPNATVAPAPVPQVALIHDTAAGVIPPGIRLPGSPSIEDWRGLLHDTPVQVVPFALPNLFSSAPFFNGTDPTQEDISAITLIQHMETARRVSSFPISDVQLIFMTTNKFVKGGYAWTWWQNLLQVANAQDKFPFLTWAEFRASFLTTMKGPDESVRLRLKLSKLRMTGDDFLKYASEFRSLASRLSALGSSKSVTDLVLDFARGLPRHLALKCPLTADSLEFAIAKVSERHFSGMLADMVAGKVRDRSPEKGRRRLYVVEEDEDDGEAPPLEEDSEEECNAVVAKPVGRRGRGRGERGGARRGARGGRGRGRGQRRPLTDVERDRLNKGLCIKCGSEDHWANECPAGAQAPVVAAVEN